MYKYSIFKFELQYACTYFEKEMTAVGSMEKTGMKSKKYKSNVYVH